MPFVPDPDVKWDVFVSYAHVDNVEGWVEAFHNLLLIKLNLLIGRAGEIQIWRDEKLDEATRFDAVIRSRVQQSALFLALCSRGYGRSEYCKGEFEAFRDYYGEARLRVNDRTRVLRVRLQNIPYEELPGAADRTGAFDFFTALANDPIGTAIETGSADFRSRVDHLAKIIFMTLDDLRRPATPPPPPGTRTVFLAEVSDSQRRARERLAADLVPRGLSVVTGLPPPFPAAEHERAARGALASCKLAVHLLDSWGDNSVEGRGDRTYSQEQLRLGQELKVPQLIWISQRVVLGAAPSESGDQAWVSWLSQLEGAKRDEGQYRVVRCPPSELASLIEKQLPPAPPEPSTPRQKPSVLLDTHERDQLVALEVCKALLTSGIQPDLMAQQEDPAQNTSLFAERLKQARGLIVLLGNASEQWVRARLDEGRKLMVTAPGGWSFLGVLIAPPSDAKAQAFEHPVFKTQVLDIRPGLSPAALGPVLQGLGVR